MTDSLSSISEKAGMPPGSLVHVGDVLHTESRITLIDYSREGVAEEAISTIDELLPYKDKDTVTWVNIEGLQNIALIESIGTAFNIHPLVLEDILNTHQRPKFEEYDDYLYIVLKGLSPGSGKLSVNYEQISIIVLDNFIFTFKEVADSLFAPLYRRVKNGKGRIRSLGTDYLTYTILDTIVDQNFILLEMIDEILDALEDELLTEPTTETLATIQQVKRELISIRRSVLPLRDLLNAILRSDSSLIHERVHIYLRDVHDHALRISESIESYRDILSGLLDIYVSSVSNKMNEIMKILTVFASIFIPLTFIAGIYGMNFEYMPELHWKWAYPVLWILFITIPAVLLIYFRRKKWL
ncbi:MAG: magnesium/cobalt transporter CorA [Gammaproteobacteria bacterium]|jgi:magnesium transporter